MASGRCASACASAGRVDGGDGGSGGFLTTELTEVTEKHFFCSVSSVVSVVKKLSVTPISSVTITEQCSPSESASRSSPPGSLHRVRRRSSSPDTIYYNGHIVTMWSDHPEVEAVAIRGDRFIAVGTNADVRKLAAPTTREVDLAGQTGPTGSAGQPHASDRRCVERAGSSRAGHELHPGDPGAHSQSL